MGWSSPVAYGRRGGHGLQRPGTPGEGVTTAAGFEVFELITPSVS